MPAPTTLSVIAVRKLLSGAGLVPLLVVLLWARPGAIPSWGLLVVVVYVLAMAVLLVTLLVIARRPPGRGDGRASRLRDLAGGCRPVWPRCVTGLR